MKKQLLTTILATLMATAFLAGCSNGSQTDANGNNSGEAANQNVALEMTELYDFAINGKVYHLPLTVGEMFGEDSTVYYDDLPSGWHKEYWNQVDMYSIDTNQFIGEVYTYFDHSRFDILEYSEQYVYWYIIEREDVERSGVDFQLYGGITFDSTLEDLIALYGEPSRVSEDDVSSYRWENLNEPDTHYYNHLEFRFENGKMTYISVEHTTDESRFR